MRKYISIALIIIGLILIAIPLIGTVILNYKINANRDLLEQLSAEDLAANNALEGDFAYTDVEDLDIYSIFQELDASYEKFIIGQIVIPDLGVNLPILKGTTTTNLKVGATTMVKEQEMGKGNYPLAGHYRKNKTLFGPLLDVDIGSEIFITDKKDIYIYRVYDKKIVPDNSTDLINQEQSNKRGVPIVSLMTCYYTSKNGKRFFVLGELMDKTEFDTEVFKEMVKR